MKLLLDTHLLLWLAEGNTKLKSSTIDVLEENAGDLYFSVASLWEVTIKSGLGRADFHVAPRILRSGLQRSGLKELMITGEHVIALGELSPIHKDPFDRLLVAQALAEQMILITNDKELLRYGVLVQAV